MIIVLNKMGYIIYNNNNNNNGYHETYAKSKKEKFSSWVDVLSIEAWLDAP